MMNITQILETLPHRYPMLLVDRILEFEPGKSCKGLKNVTINEPFFQGHYPGAPIMPGVLILESMAQCAAVILLSEERFKGFLPVIGAIDNVKFKRPVVPGDQLIFDMEMLWLRGPIGCINGIASVEGQRVAEMKMTFKLLPRTTED